MWTLTLCLGMFLGMCGSINKHDFKTKEECQEARNHAEKGVGGGYAICAPKDWRKNDN